MRNLELKASCADLAAAEAVATALGASFGGELHQIDTYFRVSRGRLKLREINRAGGELIYYERAEATSARWSDYFTVPVPDCTRTRDVLSRALGVRVEIEKTRRLHLYRGARIHLDNVLRLGTFLEFEVPAGGDSASEAQSARAILDELLAAFKLPESAAIRASYSEMLADMRIPGADQPAPGMPFETR